MMMRILKKAAFLSLFEISSIGGREQKGLLVLTYHRISTHSDFDDPLKVSLKSFERQISYLKENCHILSGEELADIIKSRRSIPKKSVFISFDDGWSDNYTNAFPILKQNEVPAIIFISTDYIDTSRTFWHEELADLLKKIPPPDSSQERQALQSMLKGRPSELLQRIDRALISPMPARMPLINDLISYLKAFQLEEIDDLIRDLNSAFGHERREKYSDLLSWRQIAEMSENNISFGSHTKSHSLLTNIPGEKVREELKESKKIIEEKTGRPVNFIAYPNGNFDSSIIKIAEEEGYLAGFTCVPGTNISYERPFELKRKNVLEECSMGLGGKFSELFFKVELSGIREDVRGWLRKEKPMNKGH